MCGRRKQRNSRKKQKLSKKTQTKLKKKKRRRKCCLRCWSAICRWCCKRFGRCLKKKLYRAFEPRWDDYEFAGVDVGSLKDKFTSDRKRSSLKKNSSIVTLYKNNKPYSKTNISLKHFRLIEGLEADDLKKFSITGSKEKILEQFIDDYKKGNFSSSSIASKLNPKKLDKDQLKKILDDYTQKKLIKRKSLKDMNFDDIKRRLSIRDSKEKALDKLLADYQKGNVSKSAISKIRKLNLKDLSKERVSDIFHDLKQQQRKHRKFPSTRLSTLKEYTSLSRLKNVFENAIGK